jgi:short-subunit dehydrogenase
MADKDNGKNKDHCGGKRQGGNGAFAGNGGRLRPLAVVTGASPGIGYELARVCDLHGFDLVVAAGSVKIKECAQRISKLGVDVRAVQADLAAQAHRMQAQPTARGQR